MCQSRIISCISRGPQVIMYERSEPRSTQLSSYGYSSNILPFVLDSGQTRTPSLSPLPFIWPRPRTGGQYCRSISPIVKVSLTPRLWAGDSVCPTSNWSTLWKDRGTLSCKDSLLADTPLPGPGIRHQSKQSCSFSHELLGLPVVLQPSLWLI